MAADLPQGIARQLPPGYRAIASVSAAPAASRRFQFVALEARKGSARTAAGPSGPRPLLIFEKLKSGRYVLRARNDGVIFRSDEGGAGGCDPFESHGIAVRGRYITVEHDVACGAHWTDYVTFRFDLRSGDYVFDNLRFQSWSMSNDPKAEALVPEPVRIVRARGRPVPFAKWKRP